MSMEIDARDLPRYLSLTEAGKTPEEALSIIRKQATTGEDRPGRAKRAKTTNDTDGANIERAGGNRAPGRSITVTIPTAPVPGLMPNQAARQGSWHRRSDLRREAREVAMYAARDVLPAGWQMMTGPVVLTVFVGWPKGRRPDLDAGISAGKPYLDGLADAGIIADDKQVVEIRATHEYGHARPGVTVLTIAEATT